MPNTQEINKFGKTLDMEYLIEIAKICHSRGQVLYRLWKLKMADHNFLAKKNELSEVKSLLCDDNSLFDLAFLVNVTVHLTVLRLTLRAKSQLLPSRQ